MLLLLLLFFVSEVRCAVFYDSYSGLPITREDVKRHDKANTTFWCVTELEPCDPTEGRRVDGTCNNLLSPSSGASHTPFHRVLPPVFVKNFDYDPRLTKSGNELPLARHLRTRLVSSGRVPGQRFTMLALYFFTFMSGDVVSLQDTVNYVLWKPYCCTERGRADNTCIQNRVPDDDPVHRFSDIRCMNMTRPETFQSVGCVSNDTTPDRIVSSTPLMDLSLLYGNNGKSIFQRGRRFEGGQVKVELFNGRIWPPSSTSPVTLCLLNQKPVETRCHAMPEDGTNTLLGINVISIWLWRYHNTIATELAKVNPCWDDEKLFTMARELNIAIALQIFYYELIPAFLGYENLIKDGVITQTEEFRDIYNEKIIPQVSLEYPYVLRWMHTVQEGALKMYDKNGYYMKQFPVVNMTLRTGYIALDDHLDLITQGSFRQGSAKVDYVADPDITEVGLGDLQKSSDIMTNDLAKNRYFGFQPYVKYIEFCFGKKIRSFKDLHHFMDPERVEILQEVYESVEDIDLMAAIWSEKLIQGGYVPATVYCLVIDQLLRNIVTDRHWFERPNRPNAFNIEQLAEIRKASAARILCDVGDTVTQIQPRAFFRTGLGNPMIKCNYIQKINFSAWKDDNCSPHSIWDAFPWDFKQELPKNQYIRSTE